jgi:hypothetical protein
MKRLGQPIVVVVTLALFAVPGFADTLVLKNGTKLTGYYEGGTARVVHFRGSDGIAKDYDIIQIQEVVFEAAPSPTPAVTPAPAAAAPPSSSGPSTAACQ